MLKTIGTLRIESLENHIVFSGNLETKTYTAQFLSHLNEVNSSLIDNKDIELDFSKWEFCISSAFQVILGFIDSLLGQGKTLIIVYSVDEGLPLPWHRLLIRYLGQFPPDAQNRINTRTVNISGSPL